MLQSIEKKLPGRERAYVMINCYDDGQQYVMEQLKTIDGVTEVKSTFGSYDIITKIETPSVETLREIIAFKVRKIPKIRMTTTIVCEPLNFSKT